MKLSNKVNTLTHLYS